MPAQAQTPISLHVRKFVLSLDRTSVNVGDPFHLVLTTHVDERIGELNEVALPNLAGLEDLGDERRCTRAKTGTDCVETLTLDATTPGERTIGPATLDAIDATTKREHTFESNLVTLEVTGQPKPAETLQPNNDAVTDTLWAAARALGLLGLVAVALFAMIWGFGQGVRGPRRHAQTPTPPPPAPTSEIDWDARLRALVDALARDPTRARAVAVRAVLRTRLGAGEEETFADLVARNAANGRPETIVALSAIERAVFCEEARVADAVQEALPFLTR